MRVKGNQRNHNLSRIPGCKITCGCATKMRQCSELFVGNLTKPKSFASEEGCSNFRTSTLQRHRDCKEHKDAVHIEVMRDTCAFTKN